MDIFPQKLWGDWGPSAVGMIPGVTDTACTARARGGHLQGCWGTQVLAQGHPKDTPGTPQGHPHSRGVEPFPPSTQKWVCASPPVPPKEAEPVPTCGTHHRALQCHPCPCPCPVTLPQAEPKPPPVSRRAGDSLQPTLGTWGPRRTFPAQSPDLL